MTEHQTPSSQEDKLALARELLGKKQFSESDAITSELLAEDPQNIDAAYVRAVSMRLQKKSNSSLELLEQVLQDKPDYGRAFQERGFNYLTLRDVAQAGTAFERAVALDPSLLASWKSLTGLYKKVGNNSQTEKAQEQVSFLEKLPTELLTVISYISEGKLNDAERLCKYYLRSDKLNVEGMRLLAEIATRQKVLDDAEFLLETCIELEPDHLNAQIQFINILLRVQKFSKAYQYATALLEKHPEDRALVLALYASACTGVGENNKAISCYQELIRETPDNHFYQVSLAHVYKSDGDFARAVEHYQKAYTIRADYGDAYWSLANTKTYKFSDAEIAQMTGEEQKESTSPDDKTQLCFALGKAMEDSSNFEQSFQFYERGNALKLSSVKHNAVQLQRRIDSQIETCTKSLFEQRKDCGFDDESPIFIVGLPRAGSTLIEQILSSHSLVDGTMELHNILNLAKRLRGRDESPGSMPNYPKILTELDSDYFRRFGQQFINDTAAYRESGTYFTDKMPNNFFHVGLIKLILPNAKVIDARRNPMACCFSGFKQLFGEGQEFSYGLEEIGNYYRQYVKLMQHWDEELPGFVLRVNHEDVVANLETEVRRILDYCGLPFEQACLDYHKTERNVRTPSSEQVRQPIYTSGLDQWRNFEPFLEPLKQALGSDILQSYSID
ncbi:MAG: sulfotransferase [Pseudomonadales bacterium]